MENSINVSRPVADVSACPQYHAVKLNSSGQVVICDAAGEAVFGIIQEVPANDGEAGRICIGGECFAQAGGAFTAGDELAVDTGGHLDDAPEALYVDTSAGTAKDAVIGSHICARALADSAGSTSVVRVNFMPCPFKVTAA